MTAGRRRAYRFGVRAETAAGLRLLLKGYRILARRYRTPAGEIDLIVKRGNLIAFVEVKARHSVADAMEALTPTAEQRIATAADLWLARHPAACGLMMRFDLVLVVPWRLPVHMPDAFRPPR
ncbi:MAG TPA: YraN family protein [Afifellaceae bacterium]|nr:YraN family protein [Afifellaceae bacterium]